MLLRLVVLAGAFCLGSCSRLNDTYAVVADDTAIRNEIRANLEGDGFTKIELEVSNGVATLSGHLPSATFRDKAISDAEKVIGVTRVINHIDVP